MQYFYISEGSSVYRIPLGKLQCRSDRALICHLAWWSSALSRRLSWVRRTRSQRLYLVDFEQSLVRVHCLLLELDLNDLLLLFCRLSDHKWPLFDWILRYEWAVHDTWANALLKALLMPERCHSLIEVGTKLYAWEETVAGLVWSAALPPLVIARPLLFLAFFRWQVRTILIRGMLRCLCSISIIIGSWIVICIPIWIDTRIRSFLDTFLLFYHIVELLDKPNTGFFAWIIHIKHLFDQVVELLGTDCRWWLLRRYRSRNRRPRRNRCWWRQWLANAVLLLFQSINAHQLILDLLLIDDFQFLPFLMFSKFVVLVNNH